MPLRLTASTALTPRPPENRGAATKPPQRSATQSWHAKRCPTSSSSKVRDQRTSSTLLRKTNVLCCALLTHSLTLSLSFSLPYSPAHVFMCSRSPSQPMPRSPSIACASPAPHPVAQRSWASWWRASRTMARRCKPWDRTCVSPETPELRLPGPWRCHQTGTLATRRGGSPVRAWWPLVAVPTTLLTPATACRSWTPR